MKNRSRDYRRLAAECHRLAGTADDADSYAQYTALAQMWTDLPEEAEAGRAKRAKDAFKDTRVLQQQRQKQPKKPDEDKS